MDVNASAGAAFTLSTWIVCPTGSTPSLRARTPNTVYERSGASIGLGWTVPVGRRHMGLIEFPDGAGAALAATKVLVDNR